MKIIFDEEEIEQMIYEIMNRVIQFIYNLPEEEVKDRIRSILVEGVNGNYSKKFL